MLNPNDSKLVKIAPRRVFEQAVEQIRSLIADGSFPPGSKLPTEQELVRQFGVSRSSAREAMRVLEAEGLIEVVHGSGAYVTQDPGSSNRADALAKWLGEQEQTLEQVLQVRESIEGLTASLSAIMASEAALLDLRDILDQQQIILQRAGDNAGESLDELARLDASFHLAISQTSGNEIAREIISHILPSFTVSNKALLFVFKRAKRMEREHRAILEAMEARDPAKSEKAMRLHISRLKKEVMALKRKDPQLEKTARD